jgi:hypothetical protein
VSAPLAQVVAAHPELAEILASPAGHTEVAARITEMGHPTTEASVRRWRAKAAASGQLVPVHAEVVEAEIVEAGPVVLVPDDHKLPALVTNAIADVRPGSNVSYSRTTSNGIVRERVSFVATRHDAQMIEERLGEEQSCSVSLTMLSAEVTRAAISVVTDVAMEKLLAETKERLITCSPTLFGYEKCAVDITNLGRPNWPTDRWNTFGRLLRDFVLNDYRMTEWHPVEGQLFTYVHDDAVRPYREIYYAGITWQRRHAISRLITEDLREPQGHWLDVYNWHSECSKGDVTFDQPVIVYQGVGVSDRDGRLAYIPSRRSWLRPWIRPDKSKSSIERTHGGALVIVPRSAQSVDDIYGYLADVYTPRDER